MKEFTMNIEKANNGVIVTAESGKFIYANVEEYTRNFGDQLAKSIKGKGTDVSVKVCVMTLAEAGTVADGGATDGVASATTDDALFDTTKPITERCKTFEDAARLVGVDADEIDQTCALLPKHAAAYVKLCVIARALNEGWKPAFIKDEYRYYPWFALYWPDELASMDEADRKELEEKGLRPLPAGVGSASGGSSVGGSVLDSYLDVSLADPSYGGALASRTHEIALFFGKAFHEIWQDYLFAVE